MLTKSKLIYDLSGISRGGTVADDDHIDTRQWGFWVDNTRGLLVRQQKQKGQSLNPDLIQNLDCIDVSQVDASSCSCEHIGCPILKSDLQIPQAVEGEFENMITSISSPALLNSTFNIIPYARVPFVQYSKFGKNLIKCFIRDRYLYLISPVLFKKVTVSGIWQYPEDLKNYVNCEGEQCFTDESFYPCSNHMIEIMKKMIIENNIKFFLSTPSDTANNAADDNETDKQVKR